MEQLASQDSQSELMYTVLVNLRLVSHYGHELLDKLAVLLAMAHSIEKTTSIGYKPVQVFGYS